MTSKICQVSLVYIKNIMNCQTTSVISLKYYLPNIVLTLLRDFLEWNQNNWDVNHKIGSNIKGRYDPYFPEHSFEDGVLREVNTFKSVKSTCSDFFALWIPLGVLAPKSKRVDFTPKNNTESEPGRILSTYWPWMRFTENF